MFNVDVILAMGITDIDDKIINKSNELGTDFLNVSRKYEMEFMRDMASVNVQSPLATLRVTEFIPHIIQYIQQIINNGFGYVTDSGNVLFDVNKYGQYGKLWTHSMDTEIREAATTEKRSPRDFALWKSAKPGEPWWQAPWGRGRPGWHIECSTIASSVYGRNVDIHSGGDDLRFPHHENELAQSQSYYCCNQWVNYWIHCGHLHLKYDADKMSKSLKNYVTVPDLLSKYTPNQFRIFCLLSHYRKRIDYSDEIMQKSVSINRQLTAFLECADSYIRGNSNVEPINDSLLWESLAETQRVVRSALADDFDTPRAMEAIKTLLRKGNIELGRHTTNTDHVRSPTVIAALVAFIHRFTDTLGIQLTTRQAITDNMKDQQLTSVLDNVVKFRSAIRQQALKHRKSVSKPMKKSSQTNSEHDQNNENSDSTSQIENNNHHQISDDMLESCDKFREDLVVCGVQIKDRGKDSSWQILEDQPLKEKAADSGKASS